MRPQIYKSGEWRNMSYSPGQSPIVVNQVENQLRLFEFQASKATLRIDTNTEPRFRAEGDWEITRGDAVRIYSGDVRIFEGIVDRDISHDEKSGTISFRASGWIAEINQLLAGRIIDGTEGESLYRYQKEENLLDDLDTEDVDESDLEYEYIATPGIYENDWNDDLPRRTGYNKASIFDTRSLFSDGIFQSENNGSTGFELLLRGSSFSNSVYRKIMHDGKKTGTLFNVNLTDVISELLTQINITKPGYSIGSIDLGTITSEFAVAIPLDDRQMRYAHFIPMDIGESTELFSLLWSYEDGVQNSTPTSIKIAYLGRVVSQFDIEDIERLEFTGDVYDYSGINEEQLGRFWSNRVFSIEDRIIILQMWSTRGQTGNTYDLRYQVQWYVYDPVTGDLSDRYDQSDTESRNLIFGEYPSADLYKSVTFPRSSRDPNGDLIPYSEGYFPVVSPQTDHFPQDEYITYQDANGIYSLRNRKVIFTGSIVIEEISFEFLNTRITKILVEICKLTNSVFYIDDDKKINIVSRDFFNNVAVKTITDIESFSRKVKDNYGNESPVVRSEIIANEAFNTMLENYYINSYFAEKEDQWEIVADRNTNNVSINLLDRVTWGGISGEPAIVRSVQVRESNVIISVTRSRAS